MPAPGIREDLITRLAAFDSLALPAAATALFATLGYTSKRTLRLTSVKRFCEAFDKDGPDQEKRIFASSYQLHLPTEAQFQAELRRELRELQPSAKS